MFVFIEEKNNDFHRKKVDRLDSAGAGVPILRYK
jgi:hypothetical protein